MNYKIIYEDKDIMVCHKMAGFPVQTGKIGAKDLVSELKNYLYKKEKTSYIGIVHRLDQPVEGLIIFAKNQRAAGILGKQITGGLINKYYYAVASGTPNGEKNRLVNYLLKDNKTNSSFVTDKDKGKEAILEYQLIKQKKIEETETGYALLDICLLTGRHHQIRVQLANAGIPLLGDKKYGNETSEFLSNEMNVKNIALCAYRLEFLHPATNKKMEFKIKPEGKIFEQFLPELS